MSPATPLPAMLDPDPAASLPPTASPKPVRVRPLLRGWSHAVAAAAAVPAAGLLILSARAGAPRR